MLARTSRGDPVELADLKAACGGSSHCVLDYWCTSCLVCIAWLVAGGNNELESMKGSLVQTSKCQGGGKTMCSVAPVGALFCSEMRCF